MNDVIQPAEIVNLGAGFSTKTDHFACEWDGRKISETDLKNAIWELTKVIAKHNDHGIGCPTCHRVAVYEIAAALEAQGATATANRLTNYGSL